MALQLVKVYGGATHQIHIVKSFRVVGQLVGCFI
uniref:Bm13187, isoform b n=1 Tax=Brugia malayi TaxID=6279 RepID=A0A1I9G544_BRUMA|nr:Bm13187, isoform b [Brugia malayi]